MAKVSKSLYLNDEMSHLVDALSNSSGANFTRIVTAALVQYLLGQTTAPNPKWMKFAMAMERGSMSAKDVVFTILDDRVSDAKHKLDVARKEKFSKSINNTLVYTYEQHVDKEVGYTSEVKRTIEESIDSLEKVLERWYRTP